MVSNFDFLSTAVQALQDWADDKLVDLAGWLGVDFRVFVSEGDRRGKFFAHRPIAPPSFSFS